VVSHIHLGIVCMLVGVSGRKAWAVDLEPLIFVNLAVRGPAIMQHMHLQALHLKALFRFLPSVILASACHHRLVPRVCGEH
jgi:hypothetical protein